MGNDFREFLDADASTPPAALTEGVITVVQTELNPSFGGILSKLAVIQAVSGAISLLYCPQFGLSVTSGHGLMQYLMQYGAEVCMAGCGALFTGLSLLVASLLLRPEEVRVLRSHRLLQATVISALSLGAFACAGATIFSGLAIVWAAGATLGAITTLELGWSLRRFTYSSSLFKS